jgi:hypothetical protein
LHLVAGDTVAWRHRELAHPNFRAEDRHHSFLTAGGKTPIVKRREDQLGAPLTAIDMLQHKRLDVGFSDVVHFGVDARVGVQAKLHVDIFFKNDIDERGAGAVGDSFGHQRIGQMHKRHAQDQVQTKWLLSLYYILTQLAN